MDSKVLVVVVCYNTQDKTNTLLSRFPKERTYDVLVVNDGSADRTGEVIKRFGFTLIEHKINKGVGSAIRTGIRYAIDNNYQTMVIMAGNNKDDPNEIERLVSPIRDGSFDYVQGSRFLSGGRWDNLPLFRFVMVKVHALVFTLLTGVKCSDALNGFRAYRLGVFNDARINIWQDWLDRYELETYLHYKALKYGYRFKEVPVSKIYPQDKRNKYSHIRPIIDWWSILRPLALLLTGIKK